MISTTNHVIFSRSITRRPRPLPHKISLRNTLPLRSIIRFQSRSPHLSITALSRLVSLDICEKESFGFFDFGADLSIVLEPAVCVS